MARVAFEHVDKVYPGGARAVVDCTLRVDDGELLVCVGPSGCGKSTLLRLLAGLESVTSGTVRIGDRVVNDLPPQARNVAMVFQDYALYPFMSVRRNLEFPLKMRKLPRGEMQRRVAWAAGLLDIEPLLDRLPKQLSGGQRQRVAMGRALVREPSVFLLDEPLSNLDAKLRVQVRADIRELQQRTRTTMLYVTHDQVEAMTLGDQVAVLNQGRLQQVASPRELYAHPANVFVAGFIGNPPMNVFSTALTADARGVRIAIGTQTLPLADGGGTGELQYAGALTAGIRPEALCVAAAGDDAVQVVVDLVEWLGHETLIHGIVGEPTSDRAVRLVCRVEGMRQLVKGDVVHLRAAPSCVHLFNEAGDALPGWPRTTTT